MRFRLCGWCSGASAVGFSSSSAIAGVTRTGPLKLCPPCTTRWPTATRLCLSRLCGSSSEPVARTQNAQPVLGHTHALLCKIDDLIIYPVVGGLALARNGEIAQMRLAK